MAELAAKGFQSAPGAEAGRNVSEIIARYDVQVFQSAPGAEAGRNSAQRVMEIAHLMFQSAPGAEAGRNPDPAAAVQIREAVSIRPRR